MRLPGLTIGEQHHRAACHILGGRININLDRVMRPSETAAIRITNRQRIKRSPAQCSRAICIDRNDLHIQRTDNLQESPTPIGRIQIQHDPVGESIPIIIHRMTQPPERDGCYERLGCCDVRGHADLRIRPDLPCEPVDLLSQFQRPPRRCFEFILKRLDLLAKTVVLRPNTIRRTACGQDERGNTTDQWQPAAPI